MADYLIPQSGGGHRRGVTFLMLLLVVTVTPLCGMRVAYGKGIHVTVVAPWNETSFLQEGCEWEAAHNALQDGFYTCLQNVWSHITTDNSSGGALALTQKSQYDMLLSVMEGARRPPSQVALLKMNLAARVYSPAVEAHWQLARRSVSLIGGCSAEGRPFVLVAGVAICDEQLLQNMLEASLTNVKNDDDKGETAALFPKLDHIHPQSRGQRTVILYGIVGEERTMQLLRVVERHLDRVCLAFRHLPLWGAMWKNALSVQGYGVTVDLKNIEYKAMDEKKGDAGTERDEVNVREVGDSTEPVGGFDVQLLKQRYPELKANLSSFAEFVAEIIDRDEVKVDFHIWEIQNMGSAAVQHVMSADNDEQLGVLLNLLMNFPLHASRLSKMGSAANAKMDNAMRNTMAEIASVVHPGQVLVFFNGRRVQTPQYSLFSLLQMMEEEEQMLEGLTRVLTSHRIPSENDHGFASVSAGVMNKVLNWVTRTVRQQTPEKGSEEDEPSRRIWIPKQNIFWLNDMEGDSAYDHLPDSLEAILSVGFNGMPTFPQKNLFHVVCIADPTTAMGLQTINMMLQLESRKQPLRLGIVLADTHWSPEIKVTAEGAEMITETVVSGATAAITATVWELLSDGEGLPVIMGFFAQLARLLEIHDVINEESVQIVATDALLAAGKRTLNDLMVDPKFVVFYQETQEQLFMMHLKDLPVTLLNGKMFPEGIVWALRNGLSRELHYVRQLVHKNKLQDTDKNLYDSIMQHGGALQRYSAALYEDETYVDWTSKSVLDFLHYRRFLLPYSHAGEVPLVSGVVVLRAAVTPRNLNAILKATWQLMQCEEGAHDCSRVRLTYAVCGVVQRAGRRTVWGDLERLLLTEDGSGEKRQLRLVYDFLATVAKKSAQRLDDPAVYESFVADMNFSPELHSILDSPAASTATQQQQQHALVEGFCTQMDRQLSAANGHTAEEAAEQTEKKKEEAVYYYANGRRFVYDDKFVDDDFADASLLEMSYAKIVQSVLAKVKFEKMSTELQQAGLDNSFYASKITALAALMKRDAAHGGHGEEKRLLPPAPGPLSFVVGPAKGTVPRHKLTIVVDPIGRQSQLLVSLCDYIARSPIGAVCAVYLNPSQRVDKPMRNFYQFVGDAHVHFDAAGRVVPPAAVFGRLPSQHLLTLGVEEPESWTLFPMEAKYDLDNIVLAKLPTASYYLYATYRLNSILITGTAKETGMSSPPRGLPLMLRSSRDAAPAAAAGVTRDTLVMANLGYFQLQSAPGVWYLTVQPGDIATAFYISRINKAQVSNAANGPNNGEFNYTSGQSIPIVVTSFNGEYMTLEVAKTPGHKTTLIQDLVAASDTRAEWPPRGPRAKRPERPTLNIFSVASGHLYERFLRMMIRSVMLTSSDVHGANTTRIKFWLIENFLSPQFKELVPLLAEHYGFDVGFVTYRWPWWLNKQTEKQRTIWAYKILFLDVLFPLDVERIIFVDADQTVQSDLHELYNMDIGNAPVAYTPFCRRHPNKATTNFRFWDRGFWVDHLRGKPYHISAIYLVDVRQLRAIAGGDQYRMVYSQLSRDPNSLANLDQDLPNYMQEQVPIFSLPEEWLWCETWCGEESKARAKTIDLCNNPLTKIPKLENAKRIIDGWEDIDAELEALSEKLRKQHSKK
ncbi:UDP-glucose:glycoprotein glucosyltransferase [Trypanosoma grayi]|uniref:UDP-glucose:glycoprotein glucosyltransferase n=1 Tax=Trypanosoma grayi TaxID=71804 RepID=UPI0004F471DD|nr:UDP-glucose:glycoprotein glucosyltransferase [Trypanosoma grayi]KEG13947.1 UDP-glucose:glycoprotein glucosyltransferase [Trypanosoma grayi]